MREDAVEELLIYPVTTGTTDHPQGYYGAVEDFYDDSAERLAKHLDAGRDVVVLAEGDPMFYSSYSYLHARLADRYACEVVPGVTSVSASTAALATPIARHEDVLTVLPGTLGVPELARRLAGTDAAAIMKLGRTFRGVVEALRQAGRLDDALLRGARQHRARARAARARRRPRPGALLRDGRSCPAPTGAPTPPTGRRAVRHRLPAAPGPPARSAAAGCSSSGSARARTRGSRPRSPPRWARSSTSTATARTSSASRPGPG